MSLVELLVAVTILALAMLVSMQIYDRARKTYKQGENLIDQQQATRVGVDQLAAALRMAGYNTNPDGNHARPDEQIEAAYDTAVVIRADFDFHDPVASATPEDVLSGPGSAFLSVSTGNDEIQAFVLAKEGRVGPETLFYQADVGQTVRDGIVEDVSIDDVALIHDEPPYTLYRINLEPDGAPNAVPLIDNVRSMHFRYFDKAGNEIPPPGGADTPFARTARESIRRIGLEIEVLTADPDRDYVDPDDTDPATRAFRKFRREEDITPRNLGMIGIKDFLADSTAPGRPAGPPDLELFNGHCGGLYVQWDPNPAEDEVAYYRVRYGLDSSNLTGVRTSRDPGFYLGGGLIDDTEYFVSIEAVDAAGNVSLPSAYESKVTQNSNVPKTPENFAVTNGENGKIPVAWDRVLVNLEPTFGDPESQLPDPLARDMAGYRLYRSTNDSFSGATVVADEGVIPAMADPYYEDDDIVNCRDYYYWVTAVDQCGRESDESPSMAGRSWTDIKPIAPPNTQAFYEGSSIRVDWEAVVLDEAGNSIEIDKYQVYRAILNEADVPAASDFSYRDTVSGSDLETEYFDNTVLSTLGSDERVWYYILAKDRCDPTANESAPSEFVTPDCTFVGNLEFVSPADGDIVWGLQPVVVDIVPPSTGTYSVQIQVIDSTSNVVDQYISSPGDPEHPWSATLDFPLGDDYTIVGQASQIIGGSSCPALPISIAVSANP